MQHKQLKAILSNSRLESLWVAGGDRCVDLIRGNTGSLSGVVKSVPALSATRKSGVGYVFDGTNDYISMTEVAMTGAYTLFAWVYRESTVSALDPIIGHSTETGVLGLTYGGTYGCGIYGAGALYGESTGRVRFIAANAGNADEGLSETDSLWNFIAVTRDASNKVDGYVNGSAATRLFANVAQTGTLKINRIGTDGTNYFKLYAGIWGCAKRAMSKAELANIHLQTKSMFYPRG